MAMMTGVAHMADGHIKIGAETKKIMRKRDVCLQACNQTGILQKLMSALWNHVLLLGQLTGFKSTFSKHSTHR
jgi:hypothetical protein